MVVGRNCVAKTQMMCNYMNPVRDYRSVEKKCNKTSHAVRYASRMLQYGCIPYGMQGTHIIQFSTKRFIPMECPTNYTTIFN